MSLRNPIIKVFMNRDDMEYPEALDLWQEMSQACRNGEDPEEVLYENGLEPDYIFALEF